ncbi:MAG TPA: TIGR01906 family membrane protein [Atribacterota bacterium]|mgnify:CR=1 FL=1|nr:TIGR01906 family membrane protein [Atribacterota bacterium]
MSALRTIFWVIFIISIPVFLISSTVVLEFNCLPFYEYAYQKYHINEVTGFTNEQLLMITRHLIQFFNGKADSAQLMLEKNGKPVYLFHDYEIQHLNEVRVLFRYTFQVMIIALIFFFLYLVFTRLSRVKKKWYYFWKGLMNGNFLTLGLLFGLGITVLVGFHSLFTKFHYLVFGDPASSPWMLDPRTDHLVMMYPLNFWQDATILGIGTIIAAALLMSLISFIVLRKYRHRRSY